MGSLHTNGTADSLLTTDLPPSQPGRPYIISTQDGEIIYIPLSKSATRLLVTGKETENAFAVVGSGGSQSAPVGFHFHKETHDVFLCLQGSMNVWAGEECRTMTAGDFGSVPPGTIHQYQILGAHTEFVGLIVPGGWEEFFRFIGEPYLGPQWPMDDQRSVFDVLLPKLKAASEQFDMIPCPQHQGGAPQPWTGAENTLPGKLAPYFLQHATGPAYDVAGTVVRPLIATAESAREGCSSGFSIASLESSAQHHAAGLFASPMRKLKFATIHHAFQLVDGRVAVHLAEHAAPTVLVAGELVYVPKDTPFRLQTLSRVAKMYVFASGRGLPELMVRLGRPHRHTVLPEQAGEAVEEEVLMGLQGEFGFEVV